MIQSGMFEVLHHSSFWSLNERSLADTARTSSQREKSRLLPSNQSYPMREEAFRDEKAFVESYYNALNYVVSLVRPLSFALASPEPVSCQALIYSCSSAALSILTHMTRHDPDDQFAGTSAVRVALFGTSFVFCLSAAFLAKLAKLRLPNRLQHEGEPWIEGRADRQRRLDALEKWRCGLFLKSSVVMLLIATPLLFSGICMATCNFHPLFPYILGPLAVFLVVCYFWIAATVLSS